MLDMGSTARTGIGRKSCSPSQGQAMETLQLENDDDAGIIISIVPGDEQAWITEEEQDSEYSSSSTPSYKRGRYTEDMEIWRS